MKLNFLYYLVLITFCTSLSAQQSGSGYVSFSNAKDLATYGVQTVKKQANVEGSALLFPSSRVAYIRFKNQMRSNTVLVNFEQYRNYVIVENKDSEFMLPIKFIDSLIILNTLDHNLREDVLVTKENSDGKTLLLNVLVNDENIKLYKYCKYTLRKPSYNVALDVGSKNYSYLNRDVYMVSNKDKVVELPLKRNKIMKNKELDKKLIRFYKRNPVKLKSEDSIISLITDYSKTLQ